MISEFQADVGYSSSRCPWPKVPPGSSRMPPRPPDHSSRGPEGPRSSKIERKAGGTLGQGHL
eukprot:3859437-Pyramimonas_sp.AAC.1